MNILISQPNLYNYTLYLPYVWACLKTYCSQNPILAKQCLWLDPIIYNEDPEDMIRPYLDQPIDVLGLSCYTWNFEKNVQIAKIVKTHHPHCLVIAGGPEPDFRAPLFFQTYPEIDLVVRQDGEIPFAKILLKKVAGDPDYSNIPGLVLRVKKDDTGICGANFTGKAEPLSDFSMSPYLAESDSFQSLIAKHKKERAQEIRIYWETNRGCPYSCAFCDWGSNTHSKIRSFPMERLRAEIAWVGRLGIRYMLFTDANFGIFPRDLEIAKELVKAKETVGWPEKIHYTAAKNNEDRIVEISRILFAGGLIDYHTMSIQHTDASVLSAMERTNLPASRQISIARRLQQENIPILAQLIFGSPGDDLKKWQKTLTDMMEWGIHEEYRPYAYNLLPNAPAAEPSFLRKWGVQTILRYTYVTRRKKSVPMNQFSKTKYIVATNSYTREDWVEMYVFDTFIQALHNGGLTRFLALFLKFTHSVSLHDFYLNLWEGFRTSESRFSDLLKQCASHLSDFVSDRFPESIEEMDIKDLPNSPCYYRPEDFLLFGTLKEIEIFWKDLESLLRPCFAHLDFFESAMNYQQTIVITPHYDSRKGRRMLSELHWPEYYKECLKSCAASQTGGLSRMIPKTKPTGRFHIHFMDKSCGTHFEHSLDWWKFPRESEQWYQAYLDRVIGVDYSKSCRTYLRAVEVT